MSFRVQKAVKKKVRAPAKPLEPIFVRAKREAIKRMSNPNTTKFEDMGSIQMADGRYGKGRNALEHPKAAYNWKLPQGKKTQWADEKGGPAAADEQVELRLKAGGVAVPCLDGIDGEKNVPMTHVDGGDLVEMLEAMLSHLKAMNKDSDTGTRFHRVAIKAAMPKFGKGKDKPVAYDPAADLWKTFNNEKKTISELRQERENWLKRNKCADHFANKWKTKGNGTS